MVFGHCYNSCCSRVYARACVVKDPGNLLTKSLGSGTVDPKFALLIVLLYSLNCSGMFHTVVCISLFPCQCIPRSERMGVVLSNIVNVNIDIEHKRPLEM